MNLLVTGAAGYIGSVCVEALLRRGHRVFALDNLSAGHRDAVHSDAVFWHCDLGNAAELDRLLSSSPIDVVLHLAAEVQVDKSVRSPSPFYVVNVAYGVQLLDAMLRHNIRRMVFSSTAAVYGQPKSTPVTEDHPAQPITPYGVTKLLFEPILADYAAHSTFRWIALRYFNAAGASAERGEDHRPEPHLIPRILEAALGQRPHFDIMGTDYQTHDGTCVRDFVHVEDIAEAHALALENLEKVSGEIFNVGNSRGYSVLEVVKAARKVTGRGIAAVIGPRRPGDPGVLVAGSEKLRTRLGWQARSSDIETILASAWAWKQKFPRGYTNAQSAPAAP